MVLFRAEGPGSPEMFARRKAQDHKSQHKSTTEILKSEVLQCTQSYDQFLHLIFIIAMLIHSLLYPNNVQSSCYTDFLVLRY